MSNVQIPITNQPNQSFTVSLPQAGGNLTLDFYVYWNRIAGYWQLTISDPVTQTELINGLPILGNGGYYANLLAQYSYLGIGGLFLFPASSSTNDYPGENDWGTGYALVWADL